MFKYEKKKQIYFVNIIIFTLKKRKNEVSNCWRDRFSWCEILLVLEERNFISKLFLVASEKSKNKKLSFRQKTYTIITISELMDEKVDLALFSAGNKVSKEWALNSLKGR